jgi:aldehyde dehydrogenase (NAD+)
LTYKNLDEVIHYIQSHGKPLALYFFSSNLKNQQRVLLETSSGGAVINHVLLHLGNSNLPFGGVGASGMGGSHGVHGFRSFSHDKAVLFQGYFTLSKFYFPPYTSVMSKICYRLLKYLE